MPLRLPSMNVAIICDDKELETYNVKQDGTSSLTAFVASEAGKQFKITYSTNIEFSVRLYVDGQEVRYMQSIAGGRREVLGPYKSAHSILPFKFQELRLVDSDSEDATPATPEMGTIELKAYRSKSLGKKMRSSPHCMSEDLHRGRVSERSKKAGWHHVAFGDEIPIEWHHTSLIVDYLDSPKGPPYASFKIYYRPRELLRAQGIIPASGNDVGRQRSPINNKKRSREDRSPGPSRNRPKINVKSEELSGDAQEQQIRALQAELDALKAARQSGKSVKRELRSPSPIVVGHSGEVIDLTLDD